MKKLLLISFIFLFAAGCNPKVSQPVQEPRPQSPSSTPQEENPLGRIPFTNSTSQWENYTSDIYPMIFDVPTGAMVTIQNSGTSQQFIEILGPKVKDTYWPWINIEHYPDAPYFNPSSGAKVDTWILNNKDYPISYDSRGKDVTISGLSAIHLIHNQSVQSPGMEDFYVIAKNKLYKISFLNSAGKPADWTVYNKFLSSIKFQ